MSNHGTSRRIVLTGGGAAFLAAALTRPASAASRSFDVGGFTAVRVSVGIQAYVAVGEPQAISAESGDPANLDRLLVAVEDQELNIGFQPNSMISNNDVVVRVSVPAMGAVRAGSGAHVEVTGLSGATLSLSASSSGTIIAREALGETVTIETSSGGIVEVSGTCKQLVAKGSSGAKVLAGDLDCDSVEAKLTSGSEAAVRAKSSLTATASTNSRLEVSGNPSSRTVKTSTRGTISFAP